MSENKLLCGFECIFSKKSDVWDFFEFRNIKLDDYYFSVVDAFVYSDRRRMEIPDKFRADFFTKLIEKSFVGECFVLHLYPEHVLPINIDVYEEYVQSDCEMIIILYDFYYLEVYCKNPVWLKSLMDVVTNIPGTKVEAKYEGSDPRTEMYA